VDWEALSPEATWTLQKIAWPHYAGRSFAEIAATLGVSVRWIGERMAQLRAEIRAQKQAPTPKERASRKLAVPKELGGGRPQGGTAKSTTHSKRKKYGVQERKRRKRGQA
jgi:hypothetical protein